MLSKASDQSYLNSEKFLPKHLRRESIIAVFRVWFFAWGTEAPCNVSISFSIQFNSVSDFKTLLPSTHPYFTRLLVNLAAVSCESGLRTIKKWKVNKKCHSLFSRSSSEEKRLEIEIENWKWNKNDCKSRSRSESEMKKNLKTIPDIHCFGFYTFLEWFIFLRNLV